MHPKSKKEKNEGLKRNNETEKKKRKNFNLTVMGQKKKIIIKI